jgi:hypothetical protein
MSADELFISLMFEIINTARDCGLSASTGKLSPPACEAVSACEVTTCKGALYAKYNFTRCATQACI